MGYRSRMKQAWTIARIELRRAFFSKRAFWVYGLALLPSLIFFAAGIQQRIRMAMLQAGGTINPALMDSIGIGDTPEEVIRRLGKPSSDFAWQRRMRARPQGEKTGITSHAINPGVEARYVRMNIITPNHVGNRTARIYEFEIYGHPASAQPGHEVNLALHKTGTGSTPCSPDEGPEKAFNGSVSGGIKDRWCSQNLNPFLQVDLGAVHTVNRVVVKHASAAGESDTLDTAFFNLQASTDNRYFTTIVDAAGARFTEEISLNRTLTYFDGRRQATLQFRNGKLATNNMNVLGNFEENRAVFAGIFQYFYLRLAIFFGCLGIFMNLFRGEMLDKTLHFWFLAPAKREVLLAGKYGAGLIASIIIFTGGALLCFAVALLMQNPAEVRTYWQSVGWSHAFWYATAAALGCVGYGSVFLTAGLLLRNPILPAAVLLGWEAINGFLPEILQKLSVLYYLQSLCPIPPPMDADVPALMQLLLKPAAPASHAGAILGIFVVTALVLWVASRTIRRMEISYSSE
jgi:ABC-type transport system involved in multi-copper enzyme maturation permease subunit